MSPKIVSTPFLIPGDVHTSNKEKRLRCRKHTTPKKKGDTYTARAGYNSGVLGNPRDVLGPHNPIREPFTTVSILHFFSVEHPYSSALLFVLTFFLVSLNLFI
jgi:hypothetical protein